MICKECGQVITDFNEPCPKRQAESAVASNDGVMPVPVNRQPNETPTVGRPVLAIVQHWHTKGKRFAVMKGVDEDDCSWRTVDDDSELSHDWNVIAWDYLPELKKA